MTKTASLTILSSLFALALTLPACDSKKSETAEEAATAAPEAEAKTAAASKKLSGEYEVICGCQLKEVGVCSEHVKVDGKFVPLTLPEGSDLGKMPFCGKPDLSAKLEGEMKDGKVMATSFQLNTPAGDADKGHEGHDHGAEGHEGHDHDGMKEKPAGEEKKM